MDTPLEECERRDPKGLYKKVGGRVERGMGGNVYCVGWLGSGALFARHTCPPPRTAWVLEPCKLTSSAPPPTPPLQARAGLIKNFTGIDDPYEAPLNPEIRVSCFDQGERRRQAVHTNSLRGAGRRQAVHSVALHSLRSAGRCRAATSTSRA